jgi:hypothetical protein
MRARAQLSRRRMHDLIFLFDADGERFVGGHKLIVARRSPQEHKGTICEGLKLR